MPGYCAKCGERAADDASFCLRCGADLTAQRRAATAASTVMPLSDVKAEGGERTGSAEILLAFAGGLTALLGLVLPWVSIRVNDAESLVASGLQIGGEVIIVALLSTGVVAGAMSHWVARRAGWLALVVMALGLGGSVLMLYWGYQLTEFNATVGGHVLRTLLGNVDLLFVLGGGFWMTFAGLAVSAAAGFAAWRTLTERVTSTPLSPGHREWLPVMAEATLFTAGASAAYVGVFFFIVYIVGSGNEQSGEILFAGAAAFVAGHVIGARIPSVTLTLLSGLFGLGAGVVSILVAIVLDSPNSAVPALPAAMVLVFALALFVALSAAPRALTASLEVHRWSGRRRRVYEFMAYGVGTAIGAVTMGYAAQEIGGNAFSAGAVFLAIAADRQLGHQPAAALSSAARLSNGFEEADGFGVIIELPATAPDATARRSWSARYESVGLIAVAASVALIVPLYSFRLYGDPLQTGLVIAAAGVGVVLGRWLCSALAASLAAYRIVGAIIGIGVFWVGFAQTGPSWLTMVGTAGLGMGISVLDIDVRASLRHKDAGGRHLLMWAAAAIAAISGALLVFIVLGILSDVTIVALGLVALSGGQLARTIGMGGRHAQEQTDRA